MQVTLSAPIGEVWALVGDLSRYPEYAAGIERVDVEPEAYTCHFRGGFVHRERMRWYAPERGYASTAEEPSAFGLRDLLTLVTVEPAKHGTALTWDQYYDADDLAGAQAEFDRALKEIADNLRARFSRSA